MRNWLLSRSEASPDKLAVRSGKAGLTFAQLHVRVDTLAHRLGDLGIARGGRVGLLIGNTLEFVECMHALARIGAVAVPLNLRLLPEGVSRNLSSAECVALVSDRDRAVLAGQIHGREPQADETLSDGLTFQPLKPLSGHANAPLVNEVMLDDLHTIIFTSGTTCSCKGVALTYGNHWWNAFGSGINLGTATEDLWLSCLSPFHVGGLSILLRSVLYGTGVVLHATFDPVSVNVALEKEGVTMVSLVTTMLYRLLDLRGDRPFPASVRCVLLGGGPIPATLLKRSLDLSVPIAPTYGLTETASQTATLRPDSVARHRGSAGRSLVGVEVTIHRRGDGGVRPEPGEIVVRGPSVSRGYVNEDTRPWRNGWFQTGDLGWLDSEGYLFVSDRRTDLIVCGGENIYPAEVESVLAQHPLVVDAGVFGMADPEWGQVAMAVVVVSQPGIPSDLHAWCRSRLPPFKCPRCFYLLDSLPRTATGKLLRRELSSSIFRTSAGAAPDGK